MTLGNIPSLGRIPSIVQSFLLYVVTVTTSLGMLFGGNFAHAEYLLQSGDALELSVVGVPDLRQRSSVNLDGNTTFPLIGDIPAAGLPLSEVRAKVQELLPTKVLRRRTPEGREHSIIISPNEIVVLIAEYRPIYLSGDVSKPGEQPYRPGLTIRQAISQAGGFDIMRLRMNNPFLEQSDLRSQHEALWIEFAREQVLITRLEAELAGSSAVDWKTGATTGNPIPASVENKLKHLESQQFDLRKADYEKEKAHLVRSLEQETGRRELLREQQNNDKEGIVADNEEFERVRELLKRGAVPITRVSEVRRLTLLSSTRFLQTTVQLAAVDKEREELIRKTQRLDDLRRLELAKELQAANLRLATLKSRLQASSEKLAYTGMVRSQMARGVGSEPKLTLLRGAGQKRETISATLETELLPGDVVDVALSVDHLTGLNSQ